MFLAIVYQIINLIKNSKFKSSQFLDIFNLKIYNKNIIVHLEHFTIESFLSFYQYFFQYYYLYYVLDQKFNLNDYFSYKSLIVYLHHSIKFDFLNLHIFEFQNHHHFNYVLHVLVVYES